MPVLQERVYALNKHYNKVTEMTGAIASRHYYHPSAKMMSPEERKQDAHGLLKRIDNIRNQAFTIRNNADDQVIATLNKQAQAKRLLGTIIKKAAALQSGKVSREATSEMKAAEIAAAKEEAAAAWRALRMEPLPVGKEEVQKTAARKARIFLYEQIQANYYKLLSGMLLQEVETVGEKTSREMDDILNEMKGALRELREQSTAYSQEALVLSAMARNRVEEDYAVVKSCYVALVAKDSSTSESTGTSFDKARDLFKKCSALLLDVKSLDGETVLASPAYIVSSQECFDALME